MRVALFYVCGTDRHGGQPVACGMNYFAFIRAEVVEAASDSDALDLAQIREGESFMNAHALKDLA